MTIINLPYVSQVDGPGAGNFANDCGPASVDMFIVGSGKTATVADVYRATGVTKDQYINGGQLIKAAAKWGISLTSRYFNLAEVKAFIDQGKPMVALVHYGTFSKTGRTQSKFKGPHFLDIVGYDADEIIVHDPLWSGTGGKYLRWSEHIFWQAWDDARLDYGNPAFWGLLCNRAFPLVGSVPDNPSDPVIQKPDVIGTGIVVANALYFRHDPGGQIIGTMSQGAMLEILEPKKNGWYHARWNGIEGWVGGNPAYITVTMKPPTPPPPPTPAPTAKKFLEMTDAEKWNLVQTLMVQSGLVGSDGYVID